jgi:hypothetical protein
MSYRIDRANRRHGPTRGEIVMASRRDRSATKSCACVASWSDGDDVAHTNFSTASPSEVHRPVVSSRHRDAARNRCNAASDWAGFYAFTIRKPRESSLPRLRSDAS